MVSIFNRPTMIMSVVVRAIWARLVRTSGQPSDSIARNSPSQAARDSASWGGLKSMLPRYTGKGGFATKIVTPKSAKW